MKSLRIIFVFFAGSFLCRSLCAEEETPKLKVSPVAERPVEGQSLVEKTKDAAGPEESPSASSAADAKPEPTPAGTEPGESPETSDAEGIVPEPFPVSRYATLWENSPFQIESIAPPQQSEGLAQRFVLGGILRENGEPVVWVRERATQQSYQVRRDATNNLGLSLVEVEENMEKQSEASATVRLGNEQGVIKFDAAAAGAVPGAGMAPPPMARPAIPMPLRTPQMTGSAPLPNQNVPNTTTANVQPNAFNPAVTQPGVVPSVPGPAIPQAGQVQAPGQEQMPPPRVIRRRAIVPAAPSTP